MTDKIDIKKILADIANQYNMKLVKKIRENPKPELPEKSEKYEGMDSKKLSLELKDVELKLNKIQARNDNIKEAVIKHMNENQAENQYTKSLFDGRKLDERRINIYDKELTLVANLRMHLDSLLKKALEKEMTDKFLSENPAFEGSVDDISVQQLENYGDKLVITVSSKAKEIVPPPPATPPPAERSGVTTSDSIVN